MERQIGISDDFEWLLERASSENEHVVSVLDLPLVDHAWLFTSLKQRSPRCRNWIQEVVFVVVRVGTVCRFYCCQCPVAVTAVCAPLAVDYHYADTFEQVAPYIPEPWKTKYAKSGFGADGVKQNLAAFFPTSTGSRAHYGKIQREFSEYPDGGITKADIMRG